MRQFVVGLTGGIGSGKSAAAERFGALGAGIVDTDAVAHALTAPGGAAVPAIAAAFGPEVLTPEGALDRAAMRQRVFADPAERKRLEAILHPMIRDECERLLEATFAGGAPYALLVVPLLAESGSYRERVDRVLVVDCPEALQIERVMRRNGLSAVEAQAILAAQASRTQRLAIADDVIANTGDLAKLADDVAGLHRHYNALAGQNP